MAGLEILGGIGKGVMIGADNIRRQEAHDASLASQQEQLTLQKQQAAEQSQYRQAQLGSLNEDMAAQREQRAAAKLEKERLGKLDEIHRGVWQELGPDADPTQAGAEIFKRSVASGLAKREELEPLVKEVKGLRQRGITAAIRAGGGPELDKALTQQFGQPVTVGQTPGKDEFGRPANLFTVQTADGKVLKQLTPMQMGSILGADDILAEQERRLKMDELRSKTIENEAQAGSARAAAGKYQAEAQGQKLENEGLAKVDPAMRGARKGSGGNPPAEVQTAEWLVRNGVAKDAAGAWDMVRTARGRNAEEAIAGLVTKMQADPLNARKTPQELVAAAKSIYAEINRPEAAPMAPQAAAPRPGKPVSVSSPQEAAALPPGTEYVTPDGRVMRR